MSIIKKREKKETKNTGKMVVMYSDLSSKTKRLIEMINDPDRIYHSRTTGIIKPVISLLGNILLIERQRESFI